MKIQYECDTLSNESEIGQPNFQLIDIHKNVELLISRSNLPVEEKIDNSGGARIRICEAEQGKKNKFLIRLPLKRFAAWNVIEEALQILASNVLLLLQKAAAHRLCEPKDAIHRRISRVDQGRLCRQRGERFRRHGPVHIHPGGGDPRRRHGSLQHQPG